MILFTRVTHGTTPEAVAVAEMVNEEVSKNQEPRTHEYHVYIYFFLPASCAKSPITHQRQCFALKYYCPFRAFAHGGRWSISLSIIYVILFGCVFLVAFVHVLSLFNYVFNGIIECHVSDEPCHFLRNVVPKFFHCFLYPIHSILPTVLTLCIHFLNQFPLNVML